MILEIATGTNPRNDCKFDLHDSIFQLNLIVIYQKPLIAMVTFRHLLIVGIGGMAGSVLRYLVSILINSKTSDSLFPWGTFAVNVTGSFIIGLVAGYSLRNQTFDANWRLFLATGVCGGFTTFSAFSNESYVLLKQQQYQTLLLYVAASFLLSICATAAGYWLSR